MGDEVPKFLKSHTSHGPLTQLILYGIWARNDVDKIDFALRGYMDQDSALLPFYQLTIAVVADLRIY